MLRDYFPGAYAPDVFAIDYQWLFDRGYRAILFDVDNTLVHHNAASTEKVDALFQKLQKIGLKTALVSNNSPERLERFSQNMDTCCIAEAEKPQAAGYENALQALDIPREQAVFIGDQVFVDICGANRCGIASILVHYITVNPKAWIGFRRYLEKMILFVYKFRKSLHILEGAVKRS